MKKLFSGILLGTLLLAGCGPSNDQKPVMEKERQTLEKAKKIDALQQEAQKQQQEADKQAQ